MKDILKVTKYQLQDFKKAIIVYYAIIYTFALCLLLVKYIFDGSITISGFGSITMIFLFVAGLNSFKSDFKFMSAFNVSRKRFFLSSIITFAGVSLLMAFIDVVTNQILNRLITFEGFYNSIYHNQYFVMDLTWTFSVFLFTLGVGFFITMLYYVCNKLMKTVVSLMPVLIIILWSIISYLTNGKLMKITSNVFNFMAGETTNSYMAVLSLLLGFALFSYFNYLLIRKMIIRD
ncbi:hypothetical protein KHQ81_11765 [Mycoplasmatota bacterium]|nr:hypothetical protein KHQ81_11765 [Mycoplasmatota bacterium]